MFSAAQVVYARRAAGDGAKTHRWMFFLPRHARGRVAHGGGRGNTREKGRIRITVKKHKVYIISLRRMQSKEGPQQGAACLSVSPVVPIRGVSTGRMRKWSRWTGVGTVKQRLSGALARLHGARHEKQIGKHSHRTSTWRKFTLGMFSLTRTIIISRLP